MKEIFHLHFSISKLQKNFLGNNFTKSSPPRVKKTPQVFLTVKIYNFITKNKD